MNTFVLLLLLIPGITGKDTYPAGCVDCHTGDMRLSARLAKWNGKVDAKRLATMQAFVPKGTTLKGKHPSVGMSQVPAACMKCHATKIAPPFAPLMHGIHIARGEQSLFVTKFDGQCTHCHKLNKANGTWSVPSGAEK